MIPRRLGELLDVLAENFEQHVPSISGIDAASRGERAAYKSLAAQHRELAGRLRALADEMAGYHDLPMAAHDMTVLESPPVQQAYEQYVVALRASVAAIQAMLAE